MYHSKMWQTLLLTSLIAAVSACSGGGNNNDNSDSVGTTMPPPPPPPPPAAQTNFTDFVIEQFDNTADDTDPEQITEVDFIFPDQENVAAFDELLE